jgi:peptidoglycan/LPS O-acetylase OafA/YrhL
LSLPIQNAEPPIISARNPGIDLLRGLSILLVILNHLGLRIRLTSGVLSEFLPGQVLTDLTFNGSEAVYIFFVVSGFLITTNSLRRWGRLGAIDARAFYIRRASRIVPSLVALVAILAVLDLLHVPDYVIKQANQSLPQAIASALGLYLNWYEGHTGYLPASWDVLWSLSIEEVFYLAFPIVCLLMKRERVLAPLLALLALSQPLALASITGNPIWREKAYLPGMAGIGAGVLTAILAERYAGKARWVRMILIALGGCGVFAVLGFEDNLAHWIHHWVILLLTFSSACTVLGFHWQLKAVPGWSLKGSEWLQSFGRLSYEIYLTHAFVVLTVVRIFRASGAAIRWGVLWYLPAILASWALGWLVAKKFSGPCERAMRQKLLTLRHIKNEGAMAD